MEWRLVLEFCLVGWIVCAYILGRAHGIRHALRQIGGAIGMSAADLGVRDGKNPR